MDQHLIVRTTRRAILAGIAAAWPLGLRAQPAAMPVIGYLNDQFPETASYVLASLRSGLEEEGFVEGRNVAIEYRWARAQYDRVPEHAADLVRRRVALIIVEGTKATPLFAKEATSTIPIVAFFGGDPVKEGLVASLNHPGGNVTGAALFTGSANVLDLKRLELLQAMVPGVGSIGVLVGPYAIPSEAELRAEQAAIEARGLAVKMARVTGDADLEAAFAALAHQKVGALLESPSAFFNSHRAELVALAAKYRLPASWEWPEFVQLGGLMSYGPAITDAAHQQGVYAGRILKGEKAGDLPVVLPQKFRLAINAGTAKSLGLSIPPTLLAIADEVIE